MSVPHGGIAARANDLMKQYLHSDDSQSAPSRLTAEARTTTGTARPRRVAQRCNSDEIAWYVPSWLMHRT